MKDTCSKTVFSTNKKLYQQIDGVSMGSSLGPLLANIIMTQLERTIIKNFIDDKILLFYGRYVDDTLVVIKKEHLQLVHNTLNSFDKNLKFTVDLFDNVVPHFLDTEIHPDGLSIYCKDTNTGQYTHFDSYSPWRYKMSWISSLVHRAVKICSDNKLRRELARIKDLVAWNGFPKRVGQAIVKNKLKRLNPVNNIINSENNTDVETIWINIPYLGNTGDQLLQTLKRKLKRHLINDVRFKVIQLTQKFSYYTNMKDQISKLMKSYVVYRFNCPSCNKRYIGKTERNLCTRTEEHASTDKDSAIYNHLRTCTNHNHLKGLFSFGNDSFNEIQLDTTEVQNNTEIIDSAHNWNILLLKEALLIKQKNPELNNGIKASKDLQLFN